MTEPDDSFLVIFFECDNTYSVISTKNKGIRNINENTAEMIYKNDWYTGEIKYRGNYIILISPIK
jgi:hypothetical protein